MCIIPRMGEGIRSFNPFRVLQAHRNFRLFWIGQTISLIGTWMQQVGQGWLALQLSNSAFIVGLVSAAGSLPILFFSLYAGVIVDRRDKLRLVKIAQILLSIEAAVLWWAVWSGYITIPLLVGLAALQGLISAVEIPARQSLIVDLVGRQDVVDAIALNSGGFNLARIVGPSIAAAVIAGLGLSWCFGINAISYIAVIACLAAINLPKFVPAESIVAAREGFREGIAYIRSRRDITGIMWLIAVYSIFGFQYLSMMPVIARDVLHTGAGGYGFLVTLVGVGALSGALALAGLSSRISRGKLFRITAYSFAVLLLIFSFVRVKEIAGPLLVLIGLTMMVNGALANGSLQSLVPDELRGRVMAAYVFVYVGFTPIGSLIAGSVSHAVGVQWAIGTGAAVMLLFAIWAFWKFPEMKRV
ncbi:MAG TPA: MFS transporter [Gemmatimonadaceae bacterium]|nr:MFS transporter [Gemmatimonadaceae bacterium]